MKRFGIIRPRESFGRKVRIIGPTVATLAVRVPAAGRRGS